MSWIRHLIEFYTIQVQVLWRWRPGRMALVRRAIVSLVVSTVALLLTVLVMPGLHVNDLETVVIAVVILALFNALLRPVVLALFAGVSTIAVIVGTLVLQIVSFLFVDWLLPEFRVDGLIASFLGPIVFAVFNTLFAAILNSDSGETFYGALVAQLARRQPDTIVTDRPGLVIVQIDGLAQPILAQQVRAGRVPFISHWIRSGQMTLDKWTALLPSQTSASQAGILHGNNSFIPAFRWWEKEGQRMLVSNHPDDAAEIVRRVSDGEGLLSNDGASVGNLVSGDAARSYITMATLKDPEHGLGQSRAWYGFFVSPDKYLRTIVLTIGEVIKEYFQATVARRRGVEPSMHRGMPYPIARAATSIVLRSLSTSLVLEEMYRGTPVIYVDYTDYDEIAHHSGPERRETLDALEGIDRTLSSLVRSTAETPRPYEFVILSDHGQSLGATFGQRYGQTLEQFIAELMGGETDVQAATGRVEEWGPINAVVTEASHASGATGRMARAAFRKRSSDGAIDLAPIDQRTGSSGAEAGLPPKLVVCASGNLGLVYFARLPGRVSLEAIEQRWPGMIQKLVAHPGIGLLMGRSEERGAMIMGPAGVHYLDDGKVTGTDPTEQFGEHAVTGLRRLDGMANCPDLAAISLLDPGTGEVAAFEDLIGSHGGLGGPQTEPFILYPAEWQLDEPMVGAEAVYRQLRRWLSDMGIELGPANGRRPDESAH